MKGVAKKGREILLSFVADFFARVQKGKKKGFKRFRRNDRLHLSIFHLT